MSQAPANFLEQLHKAREANRVAHAYMLVGQDDHMHDLADKAAAILCCTSSPYACGMCQACQWLQNEGHPDKYWIKPEKIGGSLSVDKIRDLQTHLYIPPQQAQYRIVIVSHVDKLTGAAANAFLKILEEPPIFLCFMLLAAQTSTMLPTILSRCQRWHFEQNLVSTENDIHVGLARLMRKEIDAYALAASWSSLNWGDLVRKLYGATADMVKNQAQMGQSSFVLLRQLDKLHDILSYLNHTIPIQTLLALEDLLLGYVTEGS